MCLLFLDTEWETLPRESKEKGATVAKESGEVQGKAQGGEGERGERLAGGALSEEDAGAIEPKDGASSEEDQDIVNPSDGSETEGGKDDNVQGRRPYGGATDTGGGNASFSDSQSDKETDGGEEKVVDMDSGPFAGFFREDG